jgi:hypothetical protein
MESNREIFNRIKYGKLVSKDFEIYSNNIIKDVIELEEYENCQYLMDFLNSRKHENSYISI